MEAFPLIKRKLAAPRPPEPYVHRPALHAQLHAGLEAGKRLTVVCGGPGYGKSTLAAAYLRELELPAAWYALDASDADLGTWVAYVHGALAAAVPGLPGRAMELARSAASVEAVLQTVIGLWAEELAERAEDGGVLVLDDYHAVGQAPGVAKAVAYLAQYLPDNWQLLLTTREQPQLPLPQLRVRQQLVEVGVRELRFSAGELRELLLKLSGVTLTDAEAVALLGHTDGWVATVILAAQAVEGAGGDARDLLFRELEEPQALYEYLAEEVFIHQPPARQRFLLETSLLPEVEAATCRDAFGFADAAETIRALIQGNLLFPEPGAGHVYHPSFRRFLQARLADAVTAADLAALCRAAGARLAATDPEAALALLLRGRAFDEAEALVARLADDLLAQNQVERLRTLLDAFPEERAAIAFYRGEVHRLWGEFDQAIGLFRRAVELAGPTALGGRAMVHEAAIHVGRGDAAAVPLLEAGEPLLEGPGPRAFASNLRGALAFAGNRADEAIAAYERALADFRRADDAAGQAKVLNNMGLYYTRLGQFDSAIVTCTEAVAQSARAGRVPLPMIHNNLAAVLTYQGRFEEAWAAAERAMDGARLLRARRDELYAHIALGAAALGLGDWRRAEESFEAARDGALNVQDRATAAKATVALAEVALRQGQVPRARALVERGLALTGLPLEDPRQGDLAIPFAEVLLEAGELDAAGALIDRLAAEFAALGYTYRQAQLLTFAARLAEKRGAADAPALRERARRFAEAHAFTHLAGDAAAEAPGPGVAPAITIRAFGELRVEVGGTPVPAKAWKGFKTKLILAYLLAHPEGVTKEALTDLLYGEMDTTRTAILVLISRLRHALEPDLDKNTPSRFIQFVDGRYVFNAALPCQLDTRDFEYHMRRGEWKAAVALHQAPYLAELSADGPWLDIAREGYRRQAQEAHTALMRGCLEAGDDAGALEAAEANLAFDACCELAHQVKMGCLARLGQREQALRHYPIMKQVFERELGLPPSAASEALHRSIAEGRVIDRVIAAG